MVKDGTGYRVSGGIRSSTVLSLYIAGRKMNLRHPEGTKEEMANTEFRVKPHEIQPGKQMVEFWRDGQFVAGIYPHQDGIRVVSKYLDGVEHEPDYPPGVVLKLSEDVK